MTSPAILALSNPVEGLPTPKQIAFITRLAREKGQTVDMPRSRREASELIGTLLAMPRPNAASAPVEVGMYRGEDGTIYKVQRSKASRKLYAKKLTPFGGQRLTETNAVVKWHFVYAPGAIRTLTVENKLTLEQAKAFGIRYGVCCVCSATLSDAASVAAGIGPVCAKRVGGL